jgi:LysR family transcriptional regulator, benzoate and cis,cis-muconate-responsive activator of ben and cat genes
MELRHLRYFVAAAEAQNVSRAALKLHVSQPALSRQIRDLEDELGFPLFQRTAKSVSLTEAGTVFLGEARAVLQRTAEAVEKGRAVAQGGRSELHVGYAPSPTVRLIPPALRAFQALFPRIRVRLHDLSTEEMLAGVREKALQMAFLVRPSRAMLRGLHFEELTREVMCLAVSRHHALAGRRSVGLAEALGQPLVVFNRKDYPEYFEYMEGLRSRTGANVHVAEEHDSSASLIAAIEAGVGVAIVPRNFACSAGARLKLVGVSPAPEPIVIGAVWLDSGLSGAAEALCKAARDAALKEATAKPKES